MENFFCKIKNVGPHRDPLPPGRVELRSHDLHGRRLACAGMIVNVP